MMTQSELEDFVEILVHLGNEADLTGFGSPGTFGAMGDLVADVAERNNLSLTKIAIEGQCMLANTPDLPEMGHNHFLRLVQGVKNIAFEADRLGLSYNDHFGTLGGIAACVAAERGVSISAVLQEMNREQN